MPKQIVCIWKTNKPAKQRNSLMVELTSYFGWDAATALLASHIMKNEKYLLIECSVEMSMKLIFKGFFYYVKAEYHKSDDWVYDYPTTIFKVVNQDTDGYRTRSGFKASMIRNHVSSH